MRQPRNPPVLETDDSIISLDARNPVFREKPHEILDILRANKPVHHDRERDRIILTRAEDVAAALADRSLSSDPFKARAAAAAARGVRQSAWINRTMADLDDPDHARLRGLVTQAFTARSVAAMRPRIEFLATELLAAIDPARPFDLIESFAAPLPIFVIAEMIGIDRDDLDNFRLYVRELASLLGPAANEDERRRWDEARQGLNDCFSKVILERRAEPSDDLIGKLVAAKQGDDALTEAEILNICRLLLLAGNITTADLIGNGVVALLRYQKQLARLQAQPDLWPAAVEEILRYDTPVTWRHRQALDERQIAGCPVEQGQTVTAMLMAANHDPALHVRPHSFDIGRSNQKHYSFGGGTHFCLGASLARLEGTIALSKLFEYFPKLRLAQDRPLERKSHPGFSGYKAVWVEVP